MREGRVGRRGEEKRRLFSGEAEISAIGRGGVSRGKMVG
jgi:hypothetical protein